MLIVYHCIYKRQICFCVRGVHLRTLMHSNMFCITFAFIRVASLASRQRPLLTHHNTSASRRVDFLQRPLLKTTRDCDLAYLSNEKKIIMKEIKSSIVIYSTKVYTARAWSLISSSILLIFPSREKSFILYRAEESWHRLEGGGHCTTL